MPDDRSNSWFYQVMGESVGPLTKAELQHAALEGRISPETYVRQVGDEQWLSADQYSYLWTPATSSANKEREVATRLTVPTTPSVLNNLSDEIADDHRPCHGNPNTKAIPCPDCHNPLSPRATFCPKCGCPVSSLTTGSPHLTSTVVTHELMGPSIQHRANTPTWQSALRNPKAVAVSIAIFSTLLLSLWFVLSTPRWKDPTCTTSKLAILNDAIAMSLVHNFPGYDNVTADGEEYQRREIAAALGVSETSVRAECSNILLKEYFDSHLFSPTRLDSNEQRDLLPRLEKELSLSISESPELNRPFIAKVEIPLQISCFGCGDAGGTRDLLEVFDYFYDPDADSVFGQWKIRSVSYKWFADANGGNITPMSFPPLTWDDWRANRGRQLLFIAAFRQSQEME